MKLNHSYSAFKQFDNCPLRYYRQRVLKDVKDEMGVAGLEGDRQHKALENRIKFGTALPPDMASVEHLCAGVEKAARGCRILPEHEMVLTENLTPTGWWDKDAWFRTKADVLVLNPGETRALIIDWKSGKRRPDFLQMELMALTAMVLIPTLERVDTMFVWLKTKEADEETFTRAQMPKMTERLLAYVVKIERAVELNRWPAKPSGLCPYCPARSTCKYA